MYRAIAGAERKRGMVITRTGTAAATAETAIGSAAEFLQLVRAKPDKTVKKP